MYVIYLIFFQQAHFLVYFDVSISFKIFTLSSKSVLSAKLAISLSLAKFACANLETKFFAVRLLNSLVVMYLS